MEHQRGYCFERQATCRAVISMQGILCNLLQLRKTTNGSVQNSVNALQNHMTPVEEVVEDPQKHTYASILQVAKGHLAPRHLESSRSRRVHPFQS
ncbi:hypothetical protein HanRHA438_Chr02g0050891 [Helianthus annuus]|nr:hypothetical protein HanRHA438_Chr02g0050891 [Helianthus annuus]